MIGPGERGIGISRHARGVGQTDFYCDCEVYFLNFGGARQGTEPRSSRREKMKQSFWVPRSKLYIKKKEMQLSLRSILCYICLLPLYTLSLSSPIDPNRWSEAKMTPPIESPPSSTAASSSPIFSHISPSSPTDVRGAMDDLTLDSSNKNKKQSETILSSQNHDKVELPVAECRSLILQLTVLVGNLCHHVLTAVPLDQPFVGWKADATFRRSGALILQNLLLLTRATHLDLETCIHKKMSLNRKKYPVDLCKGKAGKYTEYSSSTGITKHEGQSTLHIKTESDVAKELFRDESSFPSQVESTLAFANRLPDLCTKVGAFAEERHWNRYHTPRNLVLALIGEMGELAELWQFRGDIDDDDSWTHEQHDKLGQEIADVTIYLIRLATVCQMELHEELPKLIQEE
eukprot:scaffold3988_cov162-Amphora_coffeaeformis.AAC.3